MKTIKLFSISICIGYLNVYSANLSGTVINLDRTPQAGVQITLAGRNLTTTTNQDGTWSLVGNTAAVNRQAIPVSQKIANKLLLQDGHLTLNIDGKTINGRMYRHQYANGGFNVNKNIAPRQQSAAPDTLVYTWNSKTILRDTISNLNAAGITRHFDTTINPSITYGYLTDSRNGNFYRTIRVGSQNWMAQNLNYKVDSSWCVDTTAGSCNRFGVLYQWTSAMILPIKWNSTWWSGNDKHYQGVCPSGWYIPSDTDWTILSNEITPKGSYNGDLLKSRYGWKSTPSKVAGQPETFNGGTDDYGFNALPTGYRNRKGVFLELGQCAYFWSATTNDAGTSIGRTLSVLLYYQGIGDVKINGYAIRCIRY